jgi:hypothetical protein
VASVRMCGAPAAADVPPAARNETVVGMRGESPVAL